MSGHSFATGQRLILKSNRLFADRSAGRRLTELKLQILRVMTGDGENSIPIFSKKDDGNKRIFMKITVLTVGKIKEKYLVQGIAEYSKRLSRYCKLEILEVADEKTPDKASEAVEVQIRDTEGKRLLKYIREDDYVVALAIQGKMLDSVELSKLVENLGIQGKSSLVFVIGGSLGLSDEVLSRADFLLSFSRMTFPHQLMRMILLEQVYRGYRIMMHEPYHK